MGLPLLCLLLIRFRQDGCPWVQAKAYQRHKDAEEAKQSSNYDTSIKEGGL
jgi:hypothetical protein